MKPLIIIGALLIAAPIFAETIELQSRIVIKHNAPEFGGLSGIDVSNDGTSFFAVSDKGTIWRGDIARKADGAIKDVSNLDFRPILTSKGDPVDKQNIDAEEIDHDEKGRLYISFESNSRVSMFETWDSPATLIQRPSEFLAFGYNSGPEAMSIGPDQTVLVVPERSGELTRPFPIYSYDGSGWTSPYGIRRETPYLVVGIDYDPTTKRLYVLERDFRFPTFSTQIRSFKFDDDGVSDEQLLLKSNHGKFGDLEGLSFWRDESGQAYLTLIADDNFSAFYSTEVVEFKIHPE